MHSLHVIYVAAVDNVSEQLTATTRQMAATLRGVATGGATHQR